MGMNDPLDSRLLPSKEVMHKKMSCFIPQKRPLTNHIHRENERNACVMH